MPELRDQILKVLEEVGLWPKPDPEPAPVPEPPAPEPEPVPEPPAPVEVPDPTPQPVTTEVVTSTDLPEQEPDQA